MSEVECRAGKFRKLSDLDPEKGFAAMVLEIQEDVGFAPSYVGIDEMYVDWKSDDGKRQVAFINDAFYLIEYSVNNTDQFMRLFWTGFDDETYFAHVYYNGGSYIEGIIGDYLLDQP